MNDALEKELSDIRARARNRVIIIVASIAVALAVLGTLPALFGYGPFASRIFFGGRVPVYLLNVSSGDLTVTMPFTTPTLVAANHLETVQTLQGPFTMTISDGSGEVVETLTGDAEQPMFVNLLGESCLAVFDLTGFYGEGDRSVSVVTTLDTEHRIYPITADAVVLPHRPPLDQAAGTVHWIEIVNCDSIDEAHRADLTAWGEMRIMQRYQELQDARAAAAEAAGR